MGGESPGYVDPIDYSVGRRQLAKPRRIRSVRTVHPVHRAVTTEDVIEKQRLYGSDAEVAVNIDERDARFERWQIGGRSSRRVHIYVDGPVRKGESHGRAVKVKVVQAGKSVKSSGGAFYLKTAVILSVWPRVVRPFECFRFGVVLKRSRSRVLAQLVMEVITSIVVVVG